MLSFYCIIIKCLVSIIKKKLVISCCLMVYVWLLIDIIWIRLFKCFGYLKKVNLRCFILYNLILFNFFKNCFWFFVGFLIIELKFFINVGKGLFCIMDKFVNKKVKSLW